MSGFVTIEARSALRTWRLMRRSGFVNLWSRVRSAHPAPQQNLGYCDGAALPGHSAKAESAQSNVVLRYHNNGHTAPSNSCPLLGSKADAVAVSRRVR
jgi:hypothetical protein